MDGGSLDSELRPKSDSLSVRAESSFANDPFAGLEKVTKPEEEEILKMVVPVAQQSRAEALKKELRIDELLQKRDEGKTLSEKEEKQLGVDIISLQKYERIVGIAVTDWGIASGVLNARAVEQGLDISGNKERQERREKYEKQKKEENKREAEKVIKEAIANIDLSNISARGIQQLIEIRRKLTNLADEIDTYWQELAREAGADRHTIQVIAKASF